MANHKTVTTQTHVHYLFAVFMAILMLVFGWMLGDMLGEIPGTKTYYSEQECRYVSLPGTNVINPMITIKQEADGDLLLCKKAP